MISMTKMIPLVDGVGVDMHQVLCVNPSGSIPDFVKKIVAKNQAMNGYNLIEYLLHGTIPPQQ